MRSAFVLLVTFTFVFVVGMSGCRGNLEIPMEFPTPETPPKATPVPKIEYKADAELEKKIAKIAEEAKGKVGVAAVVLETGEAAFLNADQHFPMQSVYKLPISMAVTEQVRLGKFDLDEVVGVAREDMVREGMRSPLRDKNPNGGEFTIRELIRLALVESDGTASDVLLRLVPALDVQEFLTQIDIRDMRVVNTEKELGANWQTQYDNWSTPMASVELLRWLETVVRTGSDSDWVPNYDTKTGDGFAVLYQMTVDSNPGPKRLKGLLPDGTSVAHKTGTSGTQNGITAATNDIGIIPLPNGAHIAIAVFVSDSPSDEKTREAVIAKIAKAVWDRWGRKGV